MRRAYLVAVLATLGIAGAGRSEADLIMNFPGRCGVHVHDMAAYYFCHFDVHVWLSNEEDDLYKVEGHVWHTGDNEYKWIGRLIGTELVDVVPGEWLGTECMTEGGSTQNVHCRQTGSDNSVKAVAYKVGSETAIAYTVDNWRP